MDRAGPPAGRPRSRSTARRAEASAWALSSGCVVGQQGAQDGPDRPLQRQRAQALGQQAGPAQDRGRLVGATRLELRHAEEQQALGHVPGGARVLGELDGVVRGGHGRLRPLVEQGHLGPDPAQPDPLAPPVALRRPSARVGRLGQPGLGGAGVARARPRRLPGRAARRSPPPPRPSEPSRARSSYPWATRAGPAGGARWRRWRWRAPRGPGSPRPRGRPRGGPGPPAHRRTARRRPGRRPAATRPPRPPRPGPSPAAMSTARRSGSTPAAGRPWNAARSPAASSPARSSATPAPCSRTQHVGREATVRGPAPDDRARPPRRPRTRGRAHTVTPGRPRSASQPGPPSSRTGGGRTAWSASSSGRRPGPAAPWDQRNTAQGTGAGHRVGQRPGRQPGAERPGGDPALGQGGGERDQRQPVVLRLERGEQHRARRCGPGRRRSVTPAQRRLGALAEQVLDLDPRAGAAPAVAHPGQHGQQHVVPGADHAGPARLVRSSAVQASLSRLIAARARPRAAGPASRGGTTRPAARPRPGGRAGAAAGGSGRSGWSAPGSSSTSVSVAARAASAAPTPCSISRCIRVSRARSAAV